MTTQTSPTKAQILQSSQTGWSPLRIQKRPASPTKPSTPIPAQSGPLPSTTGKDGKPRDGARRSSASFSHLRNHSLVSNSPFKSPDSAPEGARYKPRPQSAYGYALKAGEEGKRMSTSASAGLGISGAGLSPVLDVSEATLTTTTTTTTVTATVKPSEIAHRRSSGGRKPALPGLSEAENEDPSGSPGLVSPRSAQARAFKPRKSRGLQELPHQQYVSRSPFLPDGDPASPKENGDYDDDHVGMEKALPSPVSIEMPPPPPKKERGMAVLPTPESETAPHISQGQLSNSVTASTTTTEVQIQVQHPSPAKHHPSLSASPRRPALTSYRLHGPRTNSSSQLPGQRRVSSNSSRRRRRRGKRVTFDERCDVVEFERDETGSEGEEGEWTEGEETGTDGEGGVGSEAEVDGELREEEWEEEMHLRMEQDRGLRVVNADADHEEHDLAGLVNQLVADSPAVGLAPSPHVPHPRPGHMPAPEFSSLGKPSMGASDPDGLLRPFTAALRDTSIDRIERDVESILRDASMLMPSGTPAEDVHSFITTDPNVSRMEPSFVSSAGHGAGAGLAEGDTSVVSDVSLAGTVEIHDTLDYEHAHPDASVTISEKEYSFIHSQATIPGDLSTITPSTEGTPYSPALRPSTPPHSRNNGRGGTVPSTPPNTSPLPRDLAQDAEDGVPLGRTHHATRAAAAHGHAHTGGGGAGGGLAPTLPDVAPYSPFMLTPGLGPERDPPTPPAAHAHGAGAGAAYSPRITREEVRARLALSRLGTGRSRRPATPTSPGKDGSANANPHTSTGTGSTAASPSLTATTAQSTQSTPVPNMFARGGPESPVPVEHPAAAAGMREVELVDPREGREGTPVRRDKALPPPPGSGSGAGAGAERPELKTQESGSVVGVRSGLERLVDGVRGAHRGQKQQQQQQQQQQSTTPTKKDAGGSPATPSPSPGKARRIPVPHLSLGRSSPSPSPTKADHAAAAPASILVGSHSHSHQAQAQKEEQENVERTNSIEERKEQILAKRRERRARAEGFGAAGVGLSDEEEEGAGAGTGGKRKLDVPKRPAGRRRSLSMGDMNGEEKGADVAGQGQGEAEMQMQMEREREEQKHKAMLLPTPNLLSDPFADSVEREVRKYIDGPRSYQIREHEVKVFSSPADREKVSHVQGAGDVDRGRAWKVIRRSSDMNEYAREIREYRKAEKPGKGHGKVFVRVLNVKGVNVPLPREPTFFAVTLNNGIHAVTTPETRLQKDSSIEQEFELIEHSKLEFTLTLKVRKDEHILAQLRPPPPPIPLPSQESILSNTSNAKSTTPTHKSAFRALFGSPKKSKQPLPRAAPPAAPMPRAQSEMPARVQEDCLARHLTPDGTLAQATISFKEIARRCDTRLFETAYPLMGCTASSAADTLSGSSVAVTSQRAVGEIVLQMFRLPPLPGIDQDALPQSLEECHRGLRHVAWHKALYHEGVLTQNGGDCSTWRRRRFRIVGANMIAFSDVTKKVTATIELKKATSLEDDQDPAVNSASATQSGISRSRSSDDNLYSYTGVQRSFRIVFEGGDEIGFFADTDDEKAKWMEVLKALIGRIPDHPLWAELVWQRQEEMAKQASAARDASKKR